MNTQNTLTFSKNAITLPFQNFNSYKISFKGEFLNLPNPSGRTWPCGLLSL
jgi:hypothetical protein